MLNKLMFNKFRGDISAELKTRTAAFAEAHPAVSLTDDDKAKLATIKAFGCNSSLVKDFAKHFLGYIAPKEAYDFVKGVVVVPISHTNRDDFETDELYEAALEAEQATTSFKLGSPVIIYNTSGSAIFSTTGNIGSSLPRSYMKGDLRAATDAEVDAAIESLSNVDETDGKVGIKNLMQLLA